MSFSLRSDELSPSPGLIGARHPYIRASPIGQVDQRILAWARRECRFAYFQASNRPLYLRIGTARQAPTATRGERPMAESRIRRRGWDPRRRRLAATCIALASAAT